MEETSSSEEVRDMVWFLWTKRVSPIEIYRQLVGLYGDGVMNAKLREMVQRVRKIVELTTMLMIASFGQTRPRRMGT